MMSEIEQSAKVTKGTGANDGEVTKGRFFAANTLRYKDDLGHV